MKWSPVSKMHTSNFWTLEDNVKTIAELRYNRDGQSIRIDSGEKRLYFIEKTGFLQSRMLLKTEYSVIIGECYFIKNQLSGITMLDGKKYSFGIDDDLLSLMGINNSLMETATIENLDQLDIFEFTALLFGFCSTLQNTKINKESVYSF